jgi:Protein of unknown function (DUF4231)
LPPQDFNEPAPEASSGSEEDQSSEKPKAPDGSPPAHGHLVSKSSALTYISKKLDPQRIWFDKKARRSKLFYYSLLGASMIATSSIVVANSLHFGSLSTGLAVVATVATGFSGMVKFQEHWIRYRNTASALEGLQLRYEVGLRPFDGPNKHGLLIEEAEKIFDKEQSQWAAKSAENVHQPTNREFPI